jgi:hypothetical protein
MGSHRLIFLNRQRRPQGLILRSQRQSQASRFSPSGLAFSLIKKSPPSANLSPAFCPMRERDAHRPYLPKRPVFHRDERTREHHSRCGTTRERGSSRLNRSGTLCTCCHRFRPSRATPQADSAEASGKTISRDPFRIAWSIRSKAFLVLRSRSKGTEPA